MKTVKKLSLFVVIPALLVFLVFAGFMIAKLYVIPGLIRKGLDEAAQDYWTGRVEIEGIHFNYLSPTFLSGIRMTAPDGTDKITIDSLKVSLGQWHKLFPTITGLEIADMTLMLNVEPGRLLLPELKSPPADSEPKKGTPIDLRFVNVHGLKIELLSNRTPYVIDANSLSVTRQDKRYTIILSSLVGQERRYFHLAGWVDPNQPGTPCNLDLTLEHNVTPRLFGITKTLLNLPEYVNIQGIVNGRLTISGPIEDYRQLALKGKIDISQVAVDIREHRVLHEFQSPVSFDGQTFEFDRYSGTFCEGSLTGSARIGLTRFQPHYFNIDYTLKNGDMTLMSNAFEHLSFLKGGSMDMVLGLETYAGKWESLDADGSVFIRKADVRFIPVVSTLLSALQLDKLDPVKASHLACRFRVEGPVMTIEQADISNPVTAIDIQPGGTYNLETGYVDLYAVALLMQKVERGLSNVPILNLFTQLKDTLTRLRIVGHYQDPPATLVKKEPVKDVAKGTLEFFQGAIKTGGELPGNILSTIFSPFDGEPNEQTPPAQKQD